MHNKAYIHFTCSVLQAVSIACLHCAFYSYFVLASVSYIHWVDVKLLPTTEVHTHLDCDVQYHSLVFFIIFRDASHDSRLIIIVYFF